MWFSSVTRWIPTREAGEVGSQGVVASQFGSMEKEKTTFNVKCKRRASSSVWHHVFFFKADCFFNVVRGCLKRDHVGTCCWVILGPRFSVGLFLFPCTIVPSKEGREREGGPCFVHPACESGRLPTLCSLRATGTTARELCSISRQIKTLLKKSERIWQAEESLNHCWWGEGGMLWTYHAMPFSIDINEACVCVCWLGVRTCTYKVK